MKYRHPAAADLALLAGGDIGFARAFRLNRHVRRCAECAVELDAYVSLRAATADAMPPGLDWESVASEMRANIRVGLEAGECVRAAPVPRGDWNPRLAIALASLIALIGSGVFLTRRQHPVEYGNPATAILRSTAEGVEIRSGSGSLELLNRKASVADQTIGAQGQVGARYVDETGAVTITNVYLQ